MKNRFQSMGVLLGIAVAAMAVHGYHPYVEDAAIYLPGIKKLLNHALYAQNTGFFAAHAGMTVFPELIAASVRLTHLPLDWALLAWQLLSLVVMLLGCRKIARLLFANPLASCGGVALVAALLTLPVAGTCLYLMDQYLTPRSLSAAAVLMMIACAAERRYVPAALWGLFAAAIHPLMFVYGVSFASIHLLLRLLPERGAMRLPEDAVPENAEGAGFGGMLIALLLPLERTVQRLFPVVSTEYHEALQRRPEFFLSSWQWYERLGLVAPFVIFWWFGTIARRRGLRELELMCQAANVFGLLFALFSVLTIPARMERFTLLQPMRSLHITYILMFLMAGGLLAEYCLRRRLLRWLLVFVPLCAGMFFAQRALFPATPHLELPGMASANPWVQAFQWIRQNTPVDAYFALDPEHMNADGEDQHSFRALAERSMMADKVKDSGVVAMFPELAETWKEQTMAQSGWSGFERADFARLKQSYGVSWVVLDTSSQAFKGPSGTGLRCPYTNRSVRVCRIE